jgi:hypothetical protein
MCSIRRLWWCLASTIRRRARQQVVRSDATSPIRRSARRGTILFPTTEVLAAEETPYGHAQHMYPTNDGGFVVEVLAASTTRAVFLYEFNAGSEPKSVMHQSGVLAIPATLKLN